VCIYEAWDHWKVRGGALGLAAGARILRRLGLGDQLKEAANQVDGFRLHFFANGTELNSLNLPACTATGWKKNMVIPRETKDGGEGEKKALVIQHGEAMVHRNIDDF
jgi:2-polyprenyl-6-methoxyphenol hydroxylase-like FAD-dependent oxidoreductase